MLEADLTTVQLIWRERPDVFHARDPFPVGGVVETRQPAPQRRRSAAFYAMRG